MLNPSRSRNYPDDWTAQGCTINNTCGPQLTKRQKPQAPSWGRAFGANPWGWSSLAWAHGKQCSRQCCVTASSCSPTKLAARHPSLLYQATLNFLPRFPLNHSSQNPQSQIFFFFLVGDEAMPWSTDVQGFGDLIQQLAHLSDRSGTLYLCSQHCWHHPVTWQREKIPGWNTVRCSTYEKVQENLQDWNASTHQVPGKIHCKSNMEVFHPKMPKLVQSSKFWGEIQERTYSPLHLPKRRL